MFTISTPLEFVKGLGVWIDEELSLSDTHSQKVHLTSMFFILSGLLVCS